MSTLEKTVLAEFSFLITQFGFSLLRHNSDVVEYVKGSLVAKVIKEPLSHIVYFELDLLDTNETLVLHELLGALAPSHVADARCSAHDESSLRSCICKISELCRRHLHAALQGNPHVLERTAEFAKANRRVATLEAQYGAIKDSANEAWQRKDFDAARRLYLQADVSLSHAERRRLHFLLHREQIHEEGKKKVSGTNGT